MRRAGPGAESGKSRERHRGQTRTPPRDRTPGVAWCSHDPDVIPPHRHTGRFVVDANRCRSVPIGQVSLPAFGRVVRCAVRVCALHDHRKRDELSARWTIPDGSTIRTRQPLLLGPLIFWARLRPPPSPSTPAQTVDSRATRSWSSFDRRSSDSAITSRRASAISTRSGGRSYSANRAASASRMKPTPSTTAWVCCWRSRPAAGRWATPCTATLFAHHSSSVRASLPSA
jgi:hypothetical protein